MRAYKRDCLSPSAANAGILQPMYRLLRPLLFQLPPHLAHGLGSAALSIHGAWPLRARRPLNAQPIETMGLQFAHPVGLAGGFDKNARLPHALGALGFSFLELGTVTAIAQAENPRPNLFRLPADRALINRLGFPNDGAAVIAKRYRRAVLKRPVGVPVGFSIGKSRSVPIDNIDKVIDDYRASLHAVAPLADFVVVNISSPNTSQLRALQDGKRARQLLLALRDDLRPGGKPLLVKVAPDMTDEAFDELLGLVADLDLAGIVATNTTVSREGLATPSDQVTEMGNGGLSGPPLKAKALHCVARARARLGPKPTIIGVGGIETADDVQRFLDAGANLIQLYTSFIYEGPSLPRRLAKDWAMRLTGGGPHLQAREPS
jgi:dihydroorotate dehydrogenase